MRSADINIHTKTGRVYAAAFRILNDNSEGVQWAELNRLIAKQDPTLHPKTINGCVWKMVQTFPEEVHKPKKGLFQLTKFSD